MIDLRFVIREGKKILQHREKYNEYECSSYECVSGGDTHQHPLYTRWEDVRLEEEEKYDFNS